MYNSNWKYPELKRLEQQKKKEIKQNWSFQAAEEQAKTGPTKNTHHNTHTLQRNCERERRRHQEPTAADSLQDLIKPDKS